VQNYRAYLEQRPWTPADARYLDQLAQRLADECGLPLALAYKRVMALARPRRCYCTMTVAPIWTRL
jgi:hypothetical protein